MMTTSTYSAYSEDVGDGQEDTHIFNEWRPRAEDDGNVEDNVRDARGRRC